MRVPPESCDHVASAARLVRGELEPPPHVGRRLRDERVGERHGALHHRQVLAVAERQEEERLLPRRRERIVVAARDALERERDGLRTEGERLRRPAVD
jgi:hypothetical protein